MAEKSAPLPLSPAETGVADRLVWRNGPHAGAVTEWWTNEATLGRAPESTFIVDDPSVSRRHARLARTPEGVFLEDLGSGNGTRLNGAAVTERTRLRDGGLVEVGGVSFVFETLVTTVTAARPERAEESGGRLRHRLLVALAALVALVLGGLLWKGRTPAPDDVEAQAGGTDSLQGAADPVRQAEELVRRGRWTQAEALLAPVWASADDAATKTRWAFVRAEAGHQRRLDEAATKLKAEDLGGVDALLALVPDDSAQAGRRDELSRARDEAGRAKTPSVDPHPAAPSSPLRVGSETKAEARPRPVPAKSASSDETDPARAAWLAGDTVRALQLSTDEGFSARVRAFDAAWQAGKAQAQGGNSAEAVRQLATARRLAAELSQGRPAPLGTEADRLFAAQSFQLASSMKADEELGRKAVRLSEAVDADPQERYRAAQAETWTRCRELYQQAYVARGPAPDEARQWFRTVCKCLPPSDEKQGRACTYAKQLGDAPELR